MIELSATDVRQAAVAASMLAIQNGNDAQSMLSVLRQIRCLQIDPIRAVERTQHLTLWSRLGNYDRDHLQTLTYQNKSLMEYWAHAASFVLAEDMALHQYLMRIKRADTKRKFAQWIHANASFRDYVLDFVQDNGPTPIEAIDDRANVPMQTNGGWSAGRNVGMILDHLWTIGDIAVADRNGIKRTWDIFDRHYDRVEELDEESVCRLAVLHTLRALGVATAKQIKKHFTRGRYPGLTNVLAQLVESKTIQSCTVPELNDDTWYRLASTTTQKAKRTTVLSPFDNLVCDRDRTQLLWDFYFRIEIYVPKDKREYGYYVLPILHKDRLIGRIDSKMDRKTNIYKINAIFVEDDFTPDESSGLELRQNLVSLAKFLGAEKLTFSRRKPTKWRSILVNQTIDFS